MGAEGGHDAVCSQFGSTHEAPWPECDCGFYAFAAREGAQSLLEYFVGTANAEGAVGWAVGRVSLWGRIVECEKGWRGQFAYPYALTVHAPAEVAERIRGLYAVDVENAEPFAAPPPAEDEPEEEDDELQTLLVEARGLVARLRGDKSPTVAVKIPPDDPKGPFEIPPEEVTTDRVLFAIFLALYIDQAVPFAGRHATRPWFATHGRAVCRSDVQKAVAFLLGDGNGKEWIDGAWRPRAGWPVFATAVSKTLAAAEEDGLIDKGTFGNGSDLHWRLTKTGRAVVRDYGRRTLAAQAIMVPILKREWSESEDTWIDTAAGELRIDENVVGKPLRGRPERFKHEIQALRPFWRQERRDAQAVGRRHYRTWIRDWLESKERTELAFTDDEVVAAVKHATRRGPVLASGIMERLAPGLGVESPSETARLSMTLVRLAKQGRVEHAGQLPGRWLWKVSTVA